MNRRNFIFYSYALAAVAVAGNLAGCSNGDDPGGGNGNENPKLTANLNSELMSVGSHKSQNNIIVVRTAEGNTPASFVALTSICTHESCTVGYSAIQNQFVCPCHGSVYNINGSVVQGPAPSALRKYSVSIEDNILTVS